MKLKDILAFCVINLMCYRADPKGNVGIVHYIEDERSPREYPLCAVQLKSRMDGAKDAETCIRRTRHQMNLQPDRYCDPLGDKNEAFDYIGSGRMVYDMQTKNFPESRNKKINLNTISHFVEVNQLAYRDNGKLWIHTDPVTRPQSDVNNETTRLVSLLKDLDSSLIDEADQSIPLPPASVQSFLKPLKDNSSFPSLVLTDHNASFTNKLAMNDSDDSTNLTANVTTEDANKLPDYKLFPFYVSVDTTDNHVTTLHYSYQWIRFEKICMRGTVGKSKAVSIAFDKDDYTSGNYSTWTESSWAGDAILARVFLVPSKQLEVSTLVTGVIILIISLFGGYIIHKRAAAIFDSSSPTATPEPVSL
ncbi:NICA-like protein [Mya arenaria]|uniref:NICA-like protein n=1 Tax=Mya arenaria TaxID=6604 RepID=A0ABY7E7Z8_MYAAR|nr:NICA-like protein [Mya arenaria]